jgi:hypothetical protein
MISERSTAGSDDRDGRGSSCVGCQCGHHGDEGPRQDDPVLFRSRVVSVHEHMAQSRNVGTVREFDAGGQDSDCIKMRVLATWKAQGAMTSWVRMRDHPYIFLA